MVNSEFIKYGSVNLEEITAIHLSGDFDSVLNLLQGQVTSDCTLVSENMGQISSLCNEKGFILCNFEIIVEQNKWLIIIEKAAKDIFLDEINKFLPFYKVSAEPVELQGYRSFKREKGEPMLPQEHLILSSEKAISVYADRSRIDEFRGELDSLSQDGWAINRKIMNDHQIKPEEMGKYRPHEIGQHVNRVSFNKGCFKGQEIIARMEYLGKLKKETKLIVHSSLDDVSKFTIVGQSYHDNEKIFSSCLGKLDSFS